MVEEDKNFETVYYIVIEIKKAFHKHVLQETIRYLLL